MLTPFPFYYEKLPTFCSVVTSLKERDIVNVKNYDEAWFTVCCENNIFQLWNKEYIETVSEAILNLVGEDLVLEVAAGDGMLSHWLREYGVNIKATDNMSWHQQNDAHDDRKRRFHRPTQIHSEVEELDGISAIRKYNPRMVIASWIEYCSELDCEILDERPEYLILIGEGNGGCTGSTKFWGDEWNEDNKTPAYWTQKGYSEKELDIDVWNICRTDYPWNHSHGSTMLYTRLLCDEKCFEGEVKK